MSTRDRAAAAFRWELLPLVALVAVKLALHLYANRDYGFLRDELAYIDDGKRLALGYIDHPPVAPFFAALARWTWGESSLSGLRLFPALSSSLLLGATMWMAREMGGGRVAMLLAGLAFLGAPIFLASGVLLQTVTFDLLWWGLFTLCFVRLAKTEERRYWLAMGALLGLGLLTKYTTIFYAAGFALALLVTADRSRLRGPYPWLAAGVALLVFLPNFAWQVDHGFIGLDYTEAINERDRAIGRTDDFLPEQFLLLGPPGAIAWLVGLWWLLRSPAAKPYRVLGWAFLFTVALFAIFQGRGYYTAAVYPPLMAAGGVALERLDLGRARRWGLGGLAALLVAGAVFSASVSLPLARPGSWYFDFASDLNEDLPEMVGWPELVETIAGVRDGLPAGEREGAAVLAGNFGEAGAVNLYGGRHGLPEVISPVNSYHEWSKGRLEAPVYIVVGFPVETLREMFGSVEAAATVRNREGIENQESGRIVYVCREPILPLAETWDELRRFG